MYPNAVSLRQVLRTCSVIGQPRCTQRYQKRLLDDEEQLRERIVYLASRFGRYGYRRVTALLRAEGWLGPMLCIGYHKRVARILRFAQDKPGARKA